jgi:hypothetical protein
MASPQDRARQAAALAARELNDPELEEKLHGLDSEQITLFVVAVQKAMRKRRILLLGYLSALFSMVLGLAFALITYVNREPGTFVGWVFFVPFLLAGASMLIFGRLANRIRVQVGGVELDVQGRPTTQLPTAKSNDS